MKRIGILYSELAGYTIACLRYLKMKYDTKILLIRWKTAENAPFDFDCLHLIEGDYVRDDLSVSDIIKLLEEFDPQALYISGWMDKGYLKIGKIFKNRNIPVIAGLDSQIKNSIKQHLGTLIGRSYLKRCIDLLWVPGERQAQFARKLGYNGDRLLYGLYSCDWEKFSSIYKKRGPAKPGRFLYVGRLISIKGIEQLVEAYQIYRKNTESPWELYIAGRGPMENEINGIEGIHYKGFLQPSELPSLMEECGVFILPSINEPWGVVIQEAAAAGMPVICSDACGAGVHLVQNNYSGFVFQTGNAKDLAYRMTSITKLNESRFKSMGSASYELSKQFSPAIWAETLMSGIEEYYKRKL